MQEFERTHYLNFLKEHAAGRQILLLHGVRQAGKATILRQYAQSLLSSSEAEPSCLHEFRFDTLRYRSVSPWKLIDEIGRQLDPDQHSRLFFYEAQALPQWQKIVTTLFEEHDVEIFLTISEKLPENLSLPEGKFFTKEVLPLSFAEFCALRKCLSPGQEDFQNYLKTGGFPQAVLSADPLTPAHEIVCDLFRSVLFDVTRNIQVRKFDLFFRVMAYIFDTAGQSISGNAIKTFLKTQKRSIDVETVYAYLKELEQQCLIYRCPRFDFKKGLELKTLEKYLPCDHTLPGALFGDGKDRALTTLKSAVYLELRRRGFEVFSCKLTKGDIDFMGRAENSEIFVGVCQRYEETSDEPQFKLLRALKEKGPRYLVTLDEMPESEVSGITVLCGREFLLKDAF